MMLLSLVLLFSACSASDIPAKPFVDAVEYALTSEAFTSVRAATWEHRAGFLVAGGDIFDRKFVSVSEAKLICDDEPECQGITFNGPDGNSIDPIWVDFKDHQQFVSTKDTEEDGWHSWFKGSVDPKMDNPLGFASTYLYGLRNARVAMGSLPPALGENKITKLMEIEDKVKDGATKYIQHRDDDSKKIITEGSREAKEYLTNEVLKAYLMQASDNPLSVPNAKGIGMQFMDVSEPVNHMFELKDGNVMPAIGFGTWQLTGELAYASTLHALRTGYRHIDTAQNYRNEEEVGRAIRDFLKESEVERTELFIANKLSFDHDFDVGKTRLRVKAQLETMGLEYFDLYMIHGPINDQRRLQNAWKDLEYLHSVGTIKSLGVSNYDFWHLNKLHSYAKVEPVYLQNKFDPYTTGLQQQDNKSIIEYCRSKEIRLMGYSLFNKWPFMMRFSPLGDPHILEIAEAHDRSTAQIMIRWALQLGVGVLPRSTNKRHIESNFLVFDFSLTDLEMRKMNSLYAMGAYIDSPWIKEIWYTPNNKEKEEL